MTDYDLVIRGGRVATASDVTDCDVGIKDGRIVALADNLAAGTRNIDAGGKLVLPADDICSI